MTTLTDTLNNVLNSLPASDRAGSSPRAASRQPKSGRPRAAATPAMAAAERPPPRASYDDYDGDENGGGGYEYDCDQPPAPPQTRREDSPSAVAAAAASVRASPQGPRARTQHDQQPRTTRRNPQERRPHHARQQYDAPEDCADDPLDPVDASRRGAGAGAGAGAGVVHRGSGAGGRSLAKRPPKSTLQKYLVPGIVLAVLAAVIGIVVLMLFMRKMRARKRRAGGARTNPSHTSSSATPGGHPPGNPHSAPVPSGPPPRFAPPAGRQRMNPIAPSGVDSVYTSVPPSAAGRIVAPHVRAKQDGAPHPNARAYAQTQNSPAKHPPQTQQQQQQPHHHHHHHQLRNEYEEGQEGDEEGNFGGAVQQAPHHGDAWEGEGGDSQWDYVADDVGAEPPHVPGEDVDRADWPTDDGQSQPGEDEGGEWGGGDGVGTADSFLYK
jgi:hypothetical protein